LLHFYALFNLNVRSGGINTTITATCLSGAWGQYGSCGQVAGEALWHDLQLACHRHCLPYLCAVPYITRDCATVASIGWRTHWDNLFDQHADSWIYTCLCVQHTSAYAYDRWVEPRTAVLMQGPPACLCTTLIVLLLRVSCAQLAPAPLHQPRSTP
jgi:hypothetical protein